MATTNFSYHPPPNGDISLKSSDGVVFLAHTIFLRMASSVFADMVSTANQNDVVELGDDAESVSLMLRFIYPPTFLADLSFDLVEKSLRMAHKYDIAGILTSIDHLLFKPSNETSPMNTDTIRTFCLAVTYGLPNTQKAAAERLRPEHYHFQASKDVKAIEAVCPSTHGVVGLLGAHSVRTQALAKLFLGEGALQRCYLAPDAGLLMCLGCFEKNYEPEYDDTYEPSWLVHWNILAFNHLISNPWTDYEKLCSVSCLDSIKSRMGVCPQCITATREAGNGGDFFMVTREVMLRAKKIIDDSEALYELP